MKTMYNLVAEKKLELRAVLASRLWFYVEQISKNPINQEKFGQKAMLNVLYWLSDGLSLLTLESMITLYSLVLPTQRICKALDKDTRISTLLQNVYIVDLEIPSGIYVSQSSRDVVQFIFMLSSGGFRLHWLSKKGLPAWLLDSRGQGFVDLVLTDGSSKLSGYLAKYMAKTFLDERLGGKKAYICSRNILRPFVDKGTVLLPYYYGYRGIDLGRAVLLREKEYMTQWLGKGRFQLFRID